MWEAVWRVFGLDLAFGICVYNEYSTYKDDLDLNDREEGSNWRRQKINNLEFLVPVPVPDSNPRPPW